jgi:hypothetical protein
MVVAGLDDHMYSNICHARRPHCTPPTQLHYPTQHYCNALGRYACSLLPTDLQVKSRAFPLFEDEWALVPLLDMLNHKDGATGFDAKMDAQGLSFTWQAGAGLDAGEELFIDYFPEYPASASPIVAFTNYGFLPPAILVRSTYREP